MIFTIQLNAKYFPREERMNKIFMVYLCFPQKEEKSGGKTFPLIPREDNGGGQRWSITGGSQGLIMRGVGMFFSLGSLLFTHKKGNCGNM